MNIDYLKTFVSVADQGSISKVTDSIFISQSAISQQLKALEQTLGVQLLERSHKGVQLTNYGKIFYQYANTIISYYTQMLTAINEAKDEKRSLHVLATNMVYSYALPCTLYQIKKEYPAYSLEIEVMDSASVEEKMAKGFGDVGFILNPPENKYVEGKKIFSNDVQLVASESFDVPAQIGIDELYKYPLLMLPQIHKTRQLIDGYLNKMGINNKKLKVLYNLDSVESIKISAMRGYGLAFIPYMAIKKELYQKQLRVIELKGFKMELDYYLVKRKATCYVDSDIEKILLYIEKILADTIC